MITHHTAQGPQAHLLCILQESPPWIVFLPAQMQTCPHTLWSLQVSLPEHHLTCLHNAQSLQHHDTTWPCAHVFHQTGREWMVLRVSVVFFEKVFRSLHEFQADTVGSIQRKMLDDLSHEAPLGFIGLDGDEDALTASHGLRQLWWLQLQLPLPTPELCVGPARFLALAS